LTTKRICKEYIFFRLEVASSASKLQKEKELIEIDLGDSVKNHTKHEDQFKIYSEKKYVHMFIVNL
jgi:hypothetical protein